jgi:di/tricarboxylate transporter
LTLHLGGGFILFSENIKREVFSMGEKRHDITVQAVKPTPKFNLKLAGFSLVFLIALYVGFTEPWLHTLSAQGHKVLMAIITVLGLWIFQPYNISFSISGALLMMLFLAYGVKPADVFSGFTSSALWVLIPALFFGFVLQKTGLGKRIAFLVIRMFKPSLGGMITAWIIIGIILALLTPSITVRTAIVIPIAAGCVQVLKLEEGSRGRAIIMLTTFAMGIIPGAGWLTGSLNGPIILGMFEAVPELKGMLTFDSYAKVTLLPVLLSSALLVIAGWLVLKPKRTTLISQEEFRRQFGQLPALTKQEIVTAAVLVAAFILFFTSRVHHLPEPAICLGAFFILSAAGIIQKADIGAGINWDLVLFIGISIGLGAVCSSSGISAWMSSIIVPAMKPIATNPWVFSLTICLFLFAWRFIDVARFLPTMAILVPILPRIEQVYGISPLVWVPLFVLAISSFVMSYTNIWALQSESMIQEKIWTPGQLARYGVVYIATSVFATLVSVPYWLSIGLFK